MISNVNKFITVLLYFKAFLFTFFSLSLELRCLETVCSISNSIHHPHCYMCVCASVHNICFQYAVLASTLYFKRFCDIVKNGAAFSKDAVFTFLFLSFFLFVFVFFFCLISCGFIPFFLHSFYSIYSDFFIPLTHLIECTLSFVNPS